MCVKTAWYIHGGVFTQEAFDCQEEPLIILCSRPAPADTNSNI